MCGHGGHHGLVKARAATHDLLAFARSLSLQLQLLHLFLSRKPTATAVLQEARIYGVHIKLSKALRMGQADCDKPPAV